jgi:hypothetical protein
VKRLILLSTMLVASNLSAYNECACASYELGICALYLQPNSSNIYYGAEAEPLPVPTPNWKSLEIRPDYHLGFDLSAEAHFNRTHTRLRLNWERLHSSDSDSTHVTGADMLGPYFNIGPDAQPYKMARGHVSHEFDSVSLNFGKQLTCCPDFVLNYYAGLTAVRIEQTLSSYFANDDETITHRNKSQSRYIGAGPEFGMDFAYQFCGGFAFIGESSISLLTGNLKNHTRFESTTPILETLEITPPNTQTTTVPDRTQVVPGLSGKLGLSYSSCYRNCSFSLDFGWQVQAYLNAIQSVDMSTEVTEPPPISEDASEVGVFALGFQRTLSNFLLAGPYITFHFGF